MILACNHISKSFVGKDIIIDGTFHIEENEKAAIVGINGAGKSTLLRMIAGELTPDVGDVVITKGMRLGYLAQKQEFAEGRSIYEEMREVKRELIDLEQRNRRLEAEMHSAEGEELAALMDAYHRGMEEFERQNGYAMESEITGILKGLGFAEEEFAKEACHLSGGQKTRLALGKLLLERPEIIMLDEPTNHLDMTSIEWLENFLSHYPGAVLIVAHDRYFLDKIVTKVIEIDQTHVRMYKGNYSDYAEKKAMMMEAMRNAWLNQQREIRHQEEVIEKLKSFNREKSIKRAESREKMLEKVELLEKPDSAEEHAHMQVNLEPRIISGNDVLSIQGLRKAYPGAAPLFSDVDIELKRGERLAVIGGNGTGKTTLLKMITGTEPVSAGSIRLGSKVEIGYYDQEHQVLHPDKTVFEELHDAYPDMNNTEVRNILAAFLFTGDDVFKMVRELSGGERGRLSLAKLMLSKSNLLILDEPTNHLDILSKEILEQALNRYTGTVLYVSHDRYFINRTATRILELTEGCFHNYIGNYDYYLEKKQQADIQMPQNKAETGNEKNSPSAGALDYRQRKEQIAKQRKRQNDLKKTEARIETLEGRNAELCSLLLEEEVYSNVERLMEINREKEEIDEELMELYQKWEELSVDADA